MTGYTCYAVGVPSTRHVEGGYCDVVEWLISHDVEYDYFTMDCGESPDKIVVAMHGHEPVWVCTPSSYTPP